MTSSSGERRCARALCTARSDVRPIRAPPLARPGSALAPLPRLARVGRPDRDGPRRGVGNRRGGDRARAPHRPLRRRSRPERRDAHRRPPARRTGGTRRASALVHGNAEQLPFQDGEFDALTFTYLLRYVDDPGATMRELARVTRSGGTIAARVRRPAGALAHALGALRSTRPAARRPRDLCGLARRRPLPWPEHPVLRAPPPEQLAELWRDSGIFDVRFRRLSFGGGVVCGADASESRAAPGVLRARTGGWRDYSRCSTRPTRSGICLCRDRRGARTDPSRRPPALGLAAFLLALGRRRARARRAQRTPAGDRIPDRILVVLATASIGGAATIGLAAAFEWTLLLLPFVVFGDVHRRGVQPRALRRPLPLRPLVRARLGRVSRSDGVRRRGRDPSAQMPCSPQRSRRSSAWRSGSSRRRCARSGAVPIASPGRSRSRTVARSRSPRRACCALPSGPTSTHLGDRRARAGAARAAPW